MTTQSSQHPAPPEAPIESGSEELSSTPRLTSTVWFRVVLISLAMVVVFWPNLRRLWDKTNPFWGEANWSHSICVPLIGLYYLYTNRDELMAATIAPLLPGRITRMRLISSVTMLSIGLIFALGPMAMERGGNVGEIAGSAGILLLISAVLVFALDWGLAMLLLGLGLYSYGIWPGQNDYVKDFGMVVALFGAVATMMGWEVMRIAWFPIAFLICAIPWPGLVYSWVAGPLQVLAANVAVWTLQFTGVSAFASGTKIYIAGYNNELRTLNVAEACAGLKSLMTFVSVGTAVAFLSSRPLWQKLVITVCSVPIAIFCNVFRVAGQGLLDHYVSQALSESFAHQFVGMIMVIPAFFLILLVGYILDHLFLEEINRREMADELTAADAERTMVVAVPRWKKQQPGERTTRKVKARLRPLRTDTVPPAMPERQAGARPANKPSAQQAPVDTQEGT